MRRHIELIIPGLFNLPLHELDSVFLDWELPALNYILRYATRVDNQVFELESVLAESLGLADMQNLPLVHAYTDDSSSGDVARLLCRAVHLKPDMRNAIVLPLDNSKETRDDIDIIFNDLNNLFNVDCYIESVADWLWLIHLKRREAPEDYPHYLSVLGKKADQYLEQSKQKLPWYQLINEIQMFMHTHEINQTRVEKGLLSINSLWCWGGGRLPEKFSSEIYWYTSDDLLKRFADRLGIMNSTPNAFGDDEVRKKSVCIELSILETLKSVRDENLKQLLSRVEQQFFKPLVHRVKSQRCSLRLRASYRHDLLLSPHSALRFWKRPQGLHHFGAE